jgi:hypothetical protein
MKTEIDLAAKYIVKWAISGQMHVNTSYDERSVFLIELINLLHERFTVSPVISYVSIYVDLNISTGTLVSTAAITRTRLPMFTFERFIRTRSVDCNSC